MEREDQYRFSFPMLRLDDPGAYLACDRCPWEHEIENDETLAELNDRAAEHAEVCR